MAEQINAQEGQRILGSVHVMCTKFREQVRDSLIRLKQQEYAIAKSEIIQAQQAIEAKRLEELQRIADNQTRPLTALEKGRLLHLQDMQDKQVALQQQQQPEILQKTFPQLLDQTASMSHYPGFLVEEQLELLITPFVQDLVGKVEELYMVNQQLLRLCSKCRQEALKERSNAATLKAKLQEFQNQIESDNGNIFRLRQRVADSAAQLDSLRSAYHKEVIQAKEQLVEHIGKGALTLDDVDNAVNRAFDTTLLVQPFGKDSDGRSLDLLLQRLIEEYNSPVDAEKKTKIGEGDPGAAAQATSDGAGANTRIMIMQNEIVQLQLKNAVLRHGLESWREKAETKTHAKNPT